MDLCSLRDRVLARVQRANISFTPTDVDYAIQTALNELDLDSYFSLVYTDTATMVVNNPQVDLSELVPEDVDNVTTEGIRPERVIRVELAYNDRGTWATATSYAVNDLVKGDGTPDSYYYVCGLANTSDADNQPGTAGGNTYWSMVLWQHGQVLPITNRDTVARLLGDSPVATPYLPANYVVVGNLMQAPGLPTICAFLTQNTLLVYPPPNLAYKLRLLIQYPLTEWEAGQSSDIDIALPNNILLPSIDGICYWLDSMHPDRLLWRQRFDLHKRKVMGQTIIDAGPAVRDPRAYQDITNWGFGPYGGYNYPYGGPLNGA